MTKRMDNDDQQRRQEWADEFRRFRQNFLFSQVKLAEQLGVSRRGVQLIEAGKVDAHTGTLRNFNALKSRHVKNSRRMEAA